ncbi:MAG: heme-copper oxidase subunit III [Acidobacteria bacterium]|nr:heme-copper oxidase subunit III [Acidobacteriota bacterium]
MTTMDQTVRVVRRGARREVAPSGLLGMVIFVGTEVMFFAGLISAFTISKAGAPRGAWNLPAGQMLPLASTATNTVALIASGALLWVAGRQHRARSSAATETLLAAIFLGALFVMLQGREWVRLIGHGVTLRSSALGAFFYVIVGTHAVHAVAALTGLGVAWWRLRAGRLSDGFFLAAQTFWYFVVLIWPVIYARVYF